MIPNKDLLNRSYLRMLNLLDFPKETTQEYQKRIRRERFLAIKKIRQERERRTHV